MQSCKHIALTLKKIGQLTAVSICLSITSITVSAHNDPSSHQIPIASFSKDYYGVIYPKNFENEGDSESTAEIVITDANTKKTLITQPAAIDIKYELDNAKELGLDNEIAVNVANSPYGMHSVVIYDDFNFDGQADIALKDGRYGCYGGSSYIIYLKNGNTFEHSQSFSDLTHGNCGFFMQDPEAQTLHTMTKSGAVWHKYATYKVVNNKPVIEHVVIEDGVVGSLWSITEETRVRGKKVIEEYKTLFSYDEEYGSPYLFDYKLENGKRLVLGDYGDEQIFYVYADKDDKVELFYEGSFLYDTKFKTLSFTNKLVEYHISETGITVRTPNKTFRINADQGSTSGSFKDLAKYKNVKVR